MIKQNPKRSSIAINDEAVVGAVLNLGRCLDLTDYNSLQLLKLGFDIVNYGKEKDLIPINKTVSGEEDLFLRFLDCLVIETTLNFLEKQGQKYDTVRSPFIEGKALYNTSGFREKTHIQICIRNPNCIKGLFWERKLDNNFDAV